jgi:hypothetical protein
MPGSTTRLGLPFPTGGDPFKPASVDFPALANALDLIVARNPQAVLSAQPVLDVGIAGQIRAGRALALADFTTLLGLSAPAGLYPLSDVNDASGNARNLTNKGTVPFGVGINGLSTTAAVFAGSTAQALYIADVGAGDPFRIRSGSIGVWWRTAKRGTVQAVVAKYGATAGVSSYLLGVDSTNVARVQLTDGTTTLTLLGQTDVADDRWHFVVVVFGGSFARLYVDGALEAAGALAAALNSAATAPLNVGGCAADGSTAATSPFYGRADEAFVTADVLNAEQIRVLMAAKAAHGLAYTPTRAHLAVRRRSRGGPLVVGDFPTSPRRLYNFTAGALTDAGLDGTSVTNNNGAVSVAGGDGAASGGYAFAGASSQYLSASDTGLPATTTARTFGGWLRTTTVSGTLVSYGGATTAGVRVGVDASGLPFVSDGTTIVTGAVAVTDGALHHVVAVIDPSPGDGLKFKLYVDGTLVATSTATPNSLTLGGANAFRVGRDTSAATAYLTGAADGVFVADAAYTPEQIRAVIAKGSLALGPSPKDEGAHVEGFDATNVYVLHDSLGSQDQVDLSVAA